MQAACWWRKSINSQQKQRPLKQAPGHGFSSKQLCVSDIALHPSLAAPAWKQPCLMHC